MAIGVVATGLMGTGVLATGVMATGVTVVFVFLGLFFEVEFFGCTRLDETVVFELFELLDEDFPDVAFVAFEAASGPLPSFGAYFGTVVYFLARFTFFLTARSLSFLKGVMSELEPDPELDPEPKLSTATLGSTGAGTGTGQSPLQSPVLEP